MGLRDIRMGGEGARRRIPGRPDAEASEVEVVGRRLVGLEVGDGSGSADGSSARAPKQHPNDSVELPPAKVIGLARHLRLTCRNRRTKSSEYGRVPG